MFNSSEYKDDKGIILYSKQDMNNYGILIHFIDEKKKENFYIFLNRPDKDYNIIDITHEENRENKYFKIKDLDEFDFRDYYIAANNDRKKIMEKVFPTLYEKMKKNINKFDEPSNCKDFHMY